MSAEAVRALALGATLTAIVVSAFWRPGLLAFLVMWAARSRAHDPHAP